MPQQIIPGNQPARAWMNLEKLLKAGYTIEIGMFNGKFRVNLKRGNDSLSEGFHENLKLLIQHLIIFHNPQ